MNIPTGQVQKLALIALEIAEGWPAADNDDDVDGGDTVDWIAGIVERIRGLVPDNLEAQGYPSSLPHVIECDACYGSGKVFPVPRRTVTCAECQGAGSHNTEAPDA